MISLISKPPVLTAVALGCLAASLSADALELVRNSTLNIPGELPAFGFSIQQNAFPGLEFDQPWKIVAESNNSRIIYIVERAGRIWRIPNPDEPSPELFLDIRDRVIVEGEGGLLGLAFHSQFHVTPNFFVFYTGEFTTESNTGHHRILSRFGVNPSHPSQVLVDSETPMIAQYDPDLQTPGGDLLFGPDGYLYVAMGGQHYNPATQIDGDFLSGILRLDIDSSVGSLPPNPHPSVLGDYHIPPDNPFVGITRFNGQPVDPNKVRTEFWALGLHYPKRMTFDADTGRMYCGDVGENVQEINVIVKGGHYGWLGQETNPVESENQIEWIKPIHQYERGDGMSFGESVTGGVVYRGIEVAQLNGLYVFADWIEGNVWAMFDVDGVNPQPSLWLTAAGPFSIADIATDPRTGDILLADTSAGLIRRLTFSDGSGASLPDRLSATGAFSDLAHLIPEPGIIPYEINHPFWSDNAIKSRWFALPDDGSILGFQVDEPWAIPPGGVWIKHFDLEMTLGDPTSRRRLETRFLVRNSNGVYGITYRWNEEQTEAFLVAENGFSEDFTIMDQGVPRVQTWTYPSRRACLSCHTKVGGTILGFNTHQLNREADFGNGDVHQLTAFSEAGYLGDSFSNREALPRYSTPSDTNYSVTHRVRSYLAANCSQCHQPGGPVFGNWDARMSQPTYLADIINGTLERNTGHVDNRVIRPNDLEHSMMYQRVSTRGENQMPPLATVLVDIAAVNLLKEWITQILPKTQSPESDFESWRDRTMPNERELNRPNDDPDHDGYSNYFEYLLKLDPASPNVLPHFRLERTPDAISIQGPEWPAYDFEYSLESSSNVAGPWTPIESAEWNNTWNDEKVRAQISLPLTRTSEQYYRVSITAP